MQKLTLALLASTAAAPLLAQETRELDAHVHGVSTFEFAMEHGRVEMNLLSPGMDLVGFEYAASSDADKDAVEGAIRTLLTPENVVTLPDDAECRLTEVLAHVHGHDAEGEHDEEDMHADHEHDEEHDEHEDHDEHGDDHDDHEHDEGDDHDHEEHAGEGAQHSEFHVRYLFDCEAPENLTSVGFPFFEQFSNAQEIEATYVTETGAGAAEIEPGTPELTLD